MPDERMIAVPLSLVEAAARMLDYARHPERSEIADQLRDLVREQELLAGLSEALEIIDDLPKPARVVLVGTRTRVLEAGNKRRDDHLHDAMALFLSEHLTISVEHPSVMRASLPPAPPIWSNDWRNKRGKRR